MATAAPPPSNEAASETGAAAAAESAGTEASGTKLPEFWRPTRAPRPVPHLHKLEKKDSNSDLHSRLKSRKVLGVGETDDGDVHRSKLSQILGHSEQLQQRIPKGFNIWQGFVFAHFGLMGLSALLFPSLAFSIQFGEQLCDPLPFRLYGVVMLTLATIFWTCAYSMPKDVARWFLFASILYLTLHISFHLYAMLLSGLLTALSHQLLLFWEVGELLLTSAYHYKTGHRSRGGIRPAPSRFAEERSRSADSDFDAGKKNA